MLKYLKTFWRAVRRLSGDDAYERYLEHYARCHLHDDAHECEGPLNRAEFFKQWQDQKWNGIKRCC
ncbi:CstA-like transporter-associated (seleno)protein [Methylomicrobium sp. RS1]|uniref:CstA-like transporter-associated (seleno)protein n=1 Tax=Candidatus Methylomicrobium oryzae TaxID=2802053 RepID=UPI0019245597|nr:YbdD/YjiX family protein [Methylomicrobium sp. RS1]MBL1262090.1 YbdD/YjiX family protein [Methylomicrobium sp. RS1]